MEIPIKAGFSRPQYLQVKIKKPSWQVFIEY